MDPVESCPNRGFSLERPAAGAPEGADEDPPSFRIVGDRPTGRLGTRFTEAGLTRRHDASRARLARLFARMAEEGWFARLSGHGRGVRPVLTSPGTYDRGYRDRTLIEPAAPLEPGHRLAATAFAQARARRRAMLDGGVARRSRTETFGADSGFREVLVAASGDPFLPEGVRRVGRWRRLIE